MARWQLRTPRAAAGPYRRALGLRAACSGEVRKVAEAFEQVQNTA